MKLEKSGKIDMTQLNPRCDKQHLSLPRFQPQRASWQMSFLLNACIIYFTLLQGTTYSSNAEQFYVTYAPYVSLTYPPQASVPVVPGTLFGSGCSFIFRAPKISDRSTEPFAETKRFKRSTSAPLSAIQCHASVPCFRATSGHSERL